MSQRQGSSQHDSSISGTKGETTELKSGVRRCTIKSRRRTDGRVHRGKPSASDDSSESDSDRFIEFLQRPDTAAAGTAAAASRGSSDAADGAGAGARNPPTIDSSDWATGTLAEGQSEVAAAAQRFQVVNIEGRSRAEFVTPDNLERMQSVPALFLEIVDEVTTGQMAFDLRGKLREIRIVFDDKDKKHAVVSLITDGHNNQAFNIQLGESKDNATGT